MDLHDLPGSEFELLGLARFWLWERFIKEHLPRTLVDGGLTTVFQPIHRLSDVGTEARAHEALTRFPTAPGIPVSLWFRVARETGFGTPLEVAAVRSALKSVDLLPEESLLFLNASVDAVNELLGAVDIETKSRLVVDIPLKDTHHPDCITAINRLRREGARIAVDDVPLASLHELRPHLTSIEPDYIKVDVLVGLAQNLMGRFNLAEGAVWCHDGGIEIVAERVEQREDLAMLFDLGVDWAQGFSLSEPVVML